MPPWPTVRVRLAGQPQAVPRLCFMILKTRTVMTWPRQLEDWACCRLPLQTLQWILSQELLPQRLASHFPLTHLQSVQRRGHAFSYWVATQHTYYLWNVQRWEWPHSSSPADSRHCPFCRGQRPQRGAQSCSLLLAGLGPRQGTRNTMLEESTIEKGSKVSLWTLEVWLGKPPPTHTHIHLFQSLRLFRNSRFQGYP